jgi:acyl dehydratase
LYTLGLIVGMSVNDTTLGTTVANLGMREVRFPKPVFHGDTLHVRTKVVAMRPSHSRADVGLVEFEHTGLNQRDEVVAVCLRMAMMKKRAAA